MHYIFLDISKLCRVGDAPLRVPQMVQLRAGRTGVRPLQNHTNLETPCFFI